ncbi:MAG: hypothetical protein AAGB29_06475 [Planctomycetota bacterium]
MSIIGTGIAAGLAQTAHQSQAVSRAEDKRRAETTRQQEETADRIEALLQTGATADADAELPDHQAAGYEQLYGDPEGERPARQESAADGAETDPAQQADGPQRPLFEHVDVQA